MAQVFAQLLNLFGANVTVTSPIIGICSDVKGTGEGNKKLMMMFVYSWVFRAGHKKTIKPFQAIF